MNQLTHPRVRLVVRDLVAGHRLMAGLYWAIFAVVYAGLNIGFGLTHGVNTSVWQLSGGQVPRYFLSAVGILLTMLRLPVYVAHGVTRRQVILGGSVFAVLICALWTALTLLGYGIEYAVVVPRLPLYPVSLGQVPGLGVVVFLLDLAYLYSGWLLGSLFYRFGVRAGILLTPVAVLPSVGAEFALNVDWNSQPLHFALGNGAPALLASLLLGLVCVAVGAAAVYAVLRTVPIRLRSA
ncbi:MAG: hypothetical protein AUI14_24720 [Actinobacteria bacterium 13_2_20CM_2_71_6]|nr:MAG: hypothetical protein AUI14_24720 [Actinobacteria bacterium 13_2_20CM_2_71_6]